MDRVKNLAAGRDLMRTFRDWRRRLAKKKRGRPPGSANKPRLDAAAETIGGALGSVMAKVDAWMAQREEIARELRAAADRVMTGESPFPLRRPVGAARKATKARKRPALSKEARERIAAAQRARWAAVKSGKARKSAKKKSDGAATQ
jgi:hypothetical protein